MSRIRVVTHDKGVEVHRITRLSKINWKVGGQEETQQFVSLQGIRRRAD